MARSRTLRSWALALWGVCLLAALTSAPGAADGPERERPPRTATAGLAGASDAALLPARLADGARVATLSGGTLRIVALLAVLAALAASPAARRGRASAASAGYRVLRARRHAIALRAPPLRPA